MVDGRVVIGDMVSDWVYWFKGVEGGDIGGTTREVWVEGYSNTIVYDK